MIRDLMVWFGVILGIRVATSFQGIPFVSENLITITAMLLVYPPVLMSFFQRCRISYWQITRDNLFLSFKILVVVCLIIFPVSFLINHYYQIIVFKRVYHAAAGGDWLWYGATQILLIAFPEEFFFRGFLNESFSFVFQSKRKIFGAPFGLSQVLVSAIFAFSHSIITLQWWHGFIFFPALVFSWLKERTDTIWAAVFFHAICNLFAYWVFLHY